VGRVGDVLRWAGSGLEIVRAAANGRKPQTHLCASLKKGGTLKG
jgi:hypothetical protein